MRLKLNGVLLFVFLLGLHCPIYSYAQMDNGSGIDLETEEMGDDDFSPEPGVTEPEEEPTANLDAPTNLTPSTSVDDSKSEPRFDWTKYQNATQVPHPYAEKGLLRITRDKTYIYKVDESEQKTAVQVRVGIYNPTNLTAPGKDGAADAVFDDNYDQTDTPAFQFDWEWQAWKSPVGKWGLSVGVGAYVAQGHGHFAGTNGINTALGYTPKEIFTFVVIPVSVGAVYRLELWHRQLFVPYGTAGGMVFGFGEFRDDNKSPKGGAVLGTYYGAGVAMNLGFFDSLARIQLDREYGINAIYLTAEYRGLISLNNKFDFGSDFINGGFLMEY